MKKISPSSKVLIFTQHDTEGNFKEAFQLGIDAYILKTEPIGYLPQIFLQVLKGEFYVSRSMEKFLKTTALPKNLIKLKTRLFVLFWRERRGEKLQNK